MQYLYGVSGLAKVPSGHVTNLARLTINFDIVCLPDSVSETRSARIVREVNNSVKINSFPVDRGRE